MAWPLSLFVGPIVNVIVALSSIFLNEREEGDLLGDNNQRRETQKMRSEEGGERGGNAPANTPTLIPPS